MELKNDYLRKRYSENDFSKHILEIKEDSLTSVHTLKLKDTSCYQVNFINTMDRLLVTGDFGNWVFCRSFIPSAEGYVSPNYWAEKGFIQSSQELEEFDSEATEKELKEYLDEYIYENYNMETDEYLENYDDEDETIDYIKGCIERVEDGEFDYKRYAYREEPSTWDCEDVIYCTKYKIWLLIVFDAFNEICRRIEANESVVI